MNKVFREKYLLVFLGLFCSFLWGSAFPAVKTVYSEFRVLEGSFSMPLLLAGIRFFLAAVMILSFYYISEKTLKLPQKKHLLTILLIGIFQTFSQYVFYFLGMANITGGKASILVSSEVFFTFIFAHFIFFDDKINKSKLIGLILGFIGVIIININKELNWEFKLVGEGFLMLSALSSAISFVLIKKISKNINIIYLTGWQMLFGSFMLFFIGIISYKDNIYTITLKGSIILVYAALLSATAFTIWNNLLKHYNLTKIGIYKFSTPIFGVLLSIIFLPEDRFSVNIIISMIFVALGIISIYYKKENKDI